MYGLWQPLENRIDSAFLPALPPKRPVTATQAIFLISKDAPLFIALTIGFWKLVFKKKKKKTEGRKRKRKKERKNLGKYGDDFNCPEVKLTTAS